MSTAWLPAAAAGGARRPPRKYRELSFAIVSGSLMGAAFVPGVPGFLAWFAFVPLLLALERCVSGSRARSSFALGYAAGFVHFLAGTHWIAALSDVALTVGWLKYLVWVLAALYLALYWGAATALAGWLARRSGVAARWTFAPAFLLVEEFRGSGELGFPWFQPGYTQHEILPILQLASWGGVTLVTLWLLLLNGALAELWARRTQRAAVLAGLLLLAPLALGGAELRQRRPPPGPAAAPGA